MYSATVVADGVEYTTNCEIMESGRKVFIPKDIDVIFCNNDPSMIRKLESLTNTSVNDIPLDDKKTINLFTEGKTLGISEFSTPFVKEKIMGLVHPQSFDDLIRISAISHGNGTWIDNAERLIAEGKNISEVVSIMMEVCQEMYDKGYDFSVHNINSAIKEFIIENGKITPVLRDTF